MPSGKEHFDNHCNEMGKADGALGRDNEGHEKGCRAPDAKDAYDRGYNDGKDHREGKDKKEDK